MLIILTVANQTIFEISDILSCKQFSLQHGLSDYRSELEKPYHILDNHHLSNPRI